MRRAATDYGDAVVGSSFDDAKATSARSARDQSAQRWNQAVSDALRQIHAVLDDDQRKRFALIVADAPGWLE